MLHKCANANCDNPFLKLSEGKLFLVESDILDPGLGRASSGGRYVRQIEHYWLCNQCAAVLTLSFERGRGMVTVPLTSARKAPPVAVHHELAVDQVTGQTSHLKSA